MESSNERATDECHSPRGGWQGETVSWCASPRTSELGTPYGFSRPLTRISLRPELGSASAELALQSLNDAAVHLADAAFAEIERRADLLHRQFFVVVEDDDQPFVAVQALGDQPHQVVLLDAASGIFTLLVFQDVDFADVLVAVRLVPLLVQADQVDGVGVEHHLLEFLDAQTHVLGQFQFGRMTAEFGFQRLVRFAQLAGLGAHQTRHPVHGPQFVQHGTANSRHAIRFELDAASQIEGVDGVHQAEHAGRDQVVQFDAFGQPCPDAFAVVFDQRQVAFDQTIAEFLLSWDRLYSVSRLPGFLLSYPVLWVQWSWPCNPP